MSFILLISCLNKQYSCCHDELIERNIDMCQFHAMSSIWPSQSQIGMTTRDPEEQPAKKDYNSNYFLSWGAETKTKLCGLNLNISLRTHAPRNMNTATQRVQSVGQRYTVVFLDLSILGAIFLIIIHIRYLTEKQSATHETVTREQHPNM